HRLSAALLFELSAAMLIAMALGVGAWVEERPPNLPRSVLALVLTVLLTLMAGGGGSGWGLGWGWAKSSRLEWAPPDHSKQQADRPDPDSGMTVPGDYQGVILWPEIKPRTALVVPVP